MLTRSAAKRFCLILLFVLRGRSAVVFNRIAIHDHNDKLPEGVLLEIFDAYRCDLELGLLQPEYEKIWNGRYGWFKFAHVCQHWRRVVLLSPSRLDMHLLVTPRQSSTDWESVTKCLPHLPILVDYSATICQSLAEKENNLALAAIEDRGRVRGIALRSCQYRALQTLSQPYPELKSLEIGHVPNLVLSLTFHTNFLSTLALSLRRLTLQGVTLASLPQLLSSATGLVELALIFNEFDWPHLLEASLFRNLQRMSCLRCLKLKWLCDNLSNTFSPLLASALAGDIIPLLKLTDFIFRGPHSYFQTIIVRLAAPSLRHLDAEICGPSTRYFSIPPLIPPLCKFICDTASQFIAVRLGLFQQNLEFSADTSPNSDHAPSRPFRIFFPKPVAPLQQLGDNLSWPPSTVEEVVVVRGADWSTGEHSIQWHAFFHPLRRVKTIQLPLEEAFNVARSFQIGGLLGLLPALEQIKVHMTGHNRDDKYKSIRKAFKPLIAARKKVGRPVVLSWV